MGKQITFFILHDDEESFFHAIAENNDRLINSKGEEYGIQEAINSTEAKFYIISNESNIFIKENGFIDSLRSDVIEFVRSYVKDKCFVTYGRMWIELNYFNEDTTVVKKEEWLNNKYSSYKKWFVKNCKNSKCKGYYIGAQTYNLYKSGIYKMMATPLLKVEF